MSLVVEIPGQDLLEVDTESFTLIRVIACQQLLSLLKENKKLHGDSLQAWPLPSQKDHASLFLKEVILRLQNKWQLPYPHAEICHCRAVNTSVVDQAILNGAHTPEKVSRLTSASTACGTCRSDVEKIIAYRLS
jgi:bacterioferritin-associated ferredoxin